MEGCDCHSGRACTLQRLQCKHGHVCRVEAMQQGTEGTERFCIKQLLKPIDNVGCHGVFSCMPAVSTELLRIVANDQTVVNLLLLASHVKPLCLYCCWQHVLCSHGYVYHFCVSKIASCDDIAEDCSMLAFCQKNNANANREITPDLTLATNPWLTTS